MTTCFRSLSNVKEKGSLCVITKNWMDFNVKSNYGQKKEGRKEGREGGREEGREEGRRGGRKEKEKRKEKNIKIVKSDPQM